MLAALVIQLALGLVVFQANRQRKANQCFLLLSLVAAAWLCCLYFTLTATAAELAAFWIRQASVSGAVLLFVFNLLRLSIKRNDPTWREIFAQSWPWAIATGIVAVFCQTSYFLERAQLSEMTGSFAPVYRHLFPYLGYFFGAGTVLIISYARDLRRTSANKRAELAFILVGAAVAVGSTLVSGVLGMFVDKSRLVWLAPSRMVLFTLIISYGIATRKIMDVGVLFRRVISYAVLSAYLIGLYALIWWLVSTVLQFSTPLAHSLAHVAAVACAPSPQR